jgi:hypothetical protein
MPMRAAWVWTKAHVAWGDAAFGQDGGGFHYDERGASDGAAAQVDQMPVRGEAIFAGILAHGGDGDAVAEFDGAYGEG